MDAERRVLLRAETSFPSEGGEDLGLQEELGPVEDDRDPPTSPGDLYFKQQDLLRQKEARKKADDEFTFEFTIPLEASRAVDDASRDMKGYHDPRWKMVVARYREAEKVRGPENARLQREVIREIETRREAFGLRDRFFAEALEDYQGLGAKVFGISFSEAREVAFLRDAVAHREVSIGDYAQWVRSERARVATDPSIGFLSRNMRLIQLTRRQTIAESWQEKDATVRGKHSNYFASDADTGRTNLFEPAAPHGYIVPEEDRDEDTIQSVRSLVQVEWEPGTNERENILMHPVETVDTTPADVEERPHVSGAGVAGDEAIEERGI